MKLKKLSASMALIGILCMMLHVCYSIFAYLTMYYNPFLKYVFAVPFMVATCLHGVFAMLAVFTQADGTRMDLYPKQNLRTILQRGTAALIFPLLILHINTFNLMQSCAESGRRGLIVLLILAQVLFFAVIITHVAVSLTKAFITMGWLTSRETQQRIDKAIYALGALLFVVAVFAIVKTQVIMFLS